MPPARSRTRSSVSHCASRTSAGKISDGWPDLSGSVTVTSVYGPQLRPGRRRATMRTRIGGGSGIDLLARAREGEDGVFDFLVPCTARFGFAPERVSFDPWGVEGGGFMRGSTLRAMAV